MTSPGPIPEQAVAAAAAALHDEQCDDGETTTCGRWKGAHGSRHQDYYRDHARVVLEAAAPAIREAERDRIRQLAVLHLANAKVADPGRWGGERWIPFADLIRKETS